MIPVRPTLPSRLLPLIASLVLSSRTLAPAASIQYLSQFHADDVGLAASTTPLDHAESPSFDQITASLPGVASSTSTLAASPAGFSFTATQSRTDADLPWVHTLLTLSFTPSTDTPFTFAGHYALHRAASSAAQTAVVISLDLGDATTGDPFVQYELNTPITADATFSFPAPSTHTLLANHTYFLSLEAFNESYPTPDGGTTADVQLSLAAVPLPTAAATGLAVLMALAARHTLARRFAAL